MAKRRAIRRDFRADRVPLIGVAIMSACVLGLARAVEFTSVGDAANQDHRRRDHVHASIMALWWITGRQRGAETYLLDKLRIRRQR